MANEFIQENPGLVLDPYVAPVDDSTMAKIGRFLMPKGDATIPGIMANLGANMAGQPGSSPRVDLLHSINRMVAGANLGQQMNKGTVGAPVPAAPVAPAPTKLSQVPEKSTSLKALEAANKANFELALAHNEAEHTGGGVGASLQNPPQGSTVPDSATPVAPVNSVAPATETGGIPISTITNMLAERAPTREEIFGGYTPDPMSIGVIASGLGTDAAIHPYTQMLNAEKAMTGQVATGATSRKATADLIGAITDVPYKRAQIADLVAKRDPATLEAAAAATERGKTGADLLAKRLDRQKTIDEYHKNPMSKAPAGPYLTALVPGARTMGDVMNAVGPENFEKILGHITTMRNTDKNVGAVMGAAQLSKEGAIDSANITRMGTVAGELTATGNSIRSEIAKARGNYQISITGTDPEKAAHKNYIDVLEKMLVDNDAKLVPIQGTIVDLGNKSAEKRGATISSAGTQKREAAKTRGKVESAKAAEARAYGIPETIPKGTGIPQDYKGKTIYIFEGAAYDADGNFISIITDKRKKR
jgi:hypothetical protein